jgi:hypothetical protein
LSSRLVVADLNAIALVGAAFVIIFIAISTLLSLIGVACDQVFGRGALRLASRCAGAAFAVGKGAAVLAVVLLFLQLFPVVRGLDRQILDSRLGHPLASTAEAALRAGRWADAPGAADRPA